MLACRDRQPSQTAHPKTQPAKQTENKPCGNCGKRNHTTDKCRFRNAECNFCKKKGHIEAACRTKQAAKVKYIILINTVRQQDTPQVQVLVTQNGIQHPFLVDTGARSNLISLAWWKAIGKPPIQDIPAKYRSATRHPIPILGTVRVDFSLLAGENVECKQLEFPVTKVDVNIIGLDTVQESNIKLVSLLRKPSERSLVCTVLDSKSLQEACQQLPREFPGLWTNELGCLKDF